jgi:hypothetical protein
MILSPKELRLCQSALSNEVAGEYISEQEFKEIEKSKKGIS